MKQECTGTIPVCYRHPGSRMIEVKEVAYDGPIPRKVMVRFNKIFLKQAANGYFFPLDEMDAYQDIWLALSRKAASLREEGQRSKGKGQTMEDNHHCLTSDLNLGPKASAATYLTSCAKIMLMNWQKRKVTPEREMFRQIEDKHLGEHGAVGIDDFDADNWNPVDDEWCVGESFSRVEREKGRIYSRVERIDGLVGRDDPIAPLDGEMTAWSLGEELEYEMPERQIDARKKLGAILAALGELESDFAQEAIAGFVAYVRANGDQCAAARLMGISKSGYYEKMKLWRALALRVAKGIEVDDL